MTIASNKRKTHMKPLNVSNMYGCYKSIGYDIVKNIYLDRESQQQPAYAYLLLLIRGLLGLNQ